MNGIFKVLAVQAITVSRIAASIGFVSLAFIPEYKQTAAALFVYACLSDVLDGVLARRWRIASLAGQALDLCGDKFLTITSVVYWCLRGVDITACFLIMFREVFLLAMRSVHVAGKALFPPARIHGGLVALLIWSATLLLVLSPEQPGTIEVYDYFVWMLAGYTTVNLAIKIRQEWSNLVKAFNL